MGDENLDLFLKESQQDIQAAKHALLALKNTPENQDPLDRIFRSTHSLKAKFDAMGFETEQSLAHALETLLAEIREDRISTTAGIVDLLFRGLDQMETALTMIEDSDTSSINPQYTIETIELLIESDQLANPPSDSDKSQSDYFLRGSTTDAHSDQTPLNTDESLGTGEDGWAEQVVPVVAATSERHSLPLEHALVPFPRMVRELAESQNKEINLRMDGKGVEVDRSLLNAVFDPLVHLLRNAVDHGIERPDQRREAGKDPRGTIELTAAIEGTDVVITLTDDGRGLPTDQIRNQALEEEFVVRTEVRQMSRAEVHQLIFEPGFSTRDDVTATSGRGMGMDIVRSRVDQLGGCVSIQSIPGEGTQVVLRIPQAGVE